MKTHLKIKICSLAAEAVIIRRNELKWKAKTVFNENVKQPHPLYFDLHRHRVHKVRPEARAAQIAYGYLRGRAYKQIEAKCHEQPDWAKVAHNVLHFSKMEDTLSPIERRTKVIKDLQAWGEAA